MRVMERRTTGPRCPPPRSTSAVSAISNSSFGDARGGIAGLEFVLRPSVDDCASPLPDLDFRYSSSRKVGFQAYVLSGISGEVPVGLGEVPWELFRT